MSVRKSAPEIQIGRAIETQRKIVNTRAIGVSVIQRNIINNGKNGKLTIRNYIKSANVRDGEIGERAKR